MGYDHYINVRRAIKAQSLKGFALTEENNFGSVTILDRKVRWMIAYQDKFTGCPSVNPADPESTIRILTIVLEDEL